MVLPARSPSSPASRILRSLRSITFLRLRASDRQLCEGSRSPRSSWSVRGGGRKWRCAAAWLPLSKNGLYGRRDLQGRPGEEGGAESEPTLRRWRASLLRLALALLHHSHLSEGWHRRCYDARPVRRQLAEYRFSRFFRLVGGRSTGHHLWLRPDAAATALACQAHPGPGDHGLRPSRYYLVRQCPRAVRPPVQDELEQLPGVRLHQACVLCNACWTLVIALVTYTTLAHPFSRLTTLLEHRLAFSAITAGVLVIGLTPAIATTAVYDMADAAGVCFMKPGTQAGNLVLFVPRAATLAAVICLYVALFIFFRRRNMKLLDMSTNDEEGQEHDAPAPKRMSLSSLRGRLPVWNRRQSEMEDGGVRTAEKPAHRPLAPIPGSPVAFSQPFDDAAPPSQPFPKLDNSSSPPPPHRSDVHLPCREVRQPSSVTQVDLDEALHDADLHPPKDVASPSIPRFKRFSSHAFSAQQSASGNATPERAAYRPLSPRQLNKRLSLLMALYPLAYSCLVAVSIARLIQQLATKQIPSAGLAWTSRYLIFSQGLVDGVLYVVVQLAFRAWTRRAQGGGSGGTGTGQGRATV
ncbi:hypothetical protein BJY59DRAFT_112038 [Rhodotorula toruloides]